MNSNLTPEQLQEAFNLVNERLLHLESRRAAPVSGPKVSLPEKFDGNVSKYRDFVSAVENVFALNGDRYPTEEIKVRFIGTLLTRDALSWFTSLVESNSPLLQSYAQFLQEFKFLFDDPLKCQNARNAVSRLKQGKGSVLSFAVKFRRLAASTGYNNEALTQHFRDGLNDDVKDVLATCRDEPTDLDSLIPYCIAIDNRLYQRRLEKSGNRSNLRPNARNISVPTASSSTAPMDLDAMKVSVTKSLTQEERQRRIQNNLCLYCGEPGHRIAQCPNRKN